MNMWAWIIKKSTDSWTKYDSNCTHILKTLLLPNNNYLTLLSSSLYGLSFYYIPLILFAFPTQ